MAAADAATKNLADSYDDEEGITKDKLHELISEMKSLGADFDEFKTPMSSLPEESMLEAVVSELCLRGFPRPCRATTSPVGCTIPAEYSLEFPNKMFNFEQIHFDGQDHHRIGIESPLRDIHITYCSNDEDGEEKEIRVPLPADMYSKPWPLEDVAKWIADLVFERCGDWHLVLKAKEQHVTRK